MKQLIMAAGLMVMALQACNNEAEDLDHKGYIVKGLAKNAKGKNVYLESYVDVAPAIIDTVRVEGGKYKLKGFVKEPGIHAIRIGKDKYIFFLLDNYHVKIDFDLEDLDNYSITGSPYGQTIKEMLKRSKESSKRLNALTQEYRNAQRAPNFMAEARRIQTEHTQTVVRHYAYLKGLIDTVQNPIIGVFAANMIDAQSESGFLMEYAKKVSQQAPNSKFVKRFVNQMKRYRGLAIGEEAPDIDLPTPEGGSMPLSSLRGKVVLLDFWASWCKPCRMANPHLVSLYKKYRSKGFTIYSVSLDRTKSRWVNAIKQDNLIWDSHVSDLKFWQSEAAKTYKVSSIPKTFLIDREGKLIAKNLRGQQIDKKLEELFN